MILSKECYLKDTCKKFREGYDCQTNDEYCPRLHKLDYLYDQSLLSFPQRQLVKINRDTADKAEYDKLDKILKNIDEFVNNGSSLYLYSEKCGNGKTTWAIRFIQVYFNKIWPSSDLVCRALFINVPKYLIELKKNISSKSEYIEHINKNILTADLVVWDEIGSKAGTEYEIENLLNLINSRLDLGLCNIYTSNLGVKDDLSAALGPRLASRISLSVRIHFDAGDYRPIVQKQTVEELRNV